MELKRVAVNQVSDSCLTIQIASAAPEGTRHPAANLSEILHQGFQPEEKEEKKT